jgi:spermidine dehydrogenase
MTKRDRELGRDGEITRRDFLDGVALAIGSAVASTVAGAPRAYAETGPAPQQPSVSGQGAAVGVAPADATNYPPMLTGMRGQDDAAVNAGHAVRDGRALASPVDTGELYDVVVVGAGMAGLSAAYFYRKQIPRSKVLVIDGCDDFGGHARRNEFMVDGKRLIAGGGTAALWRPNTFPPEAQELLRDIGIDREHYYEQQANTPNPPPRLGSQAGDVLRQGILWSGPSRGERTAGIGPPGRRVDNGR